MVRQFPHLSDVQLRFIEDDAEQAFWQKATQDASFGGLRFKARFAGKAKGPPRRLTPDEALGYAVWFAQILGDAAGHFAYLLTHAFAIRKELDLHDVAYLRARFQEFISKRLDPSVVKQFFTAVITETGPPDVPRRGFDKVLTSILKEIPKARVRVLSTILAEHKMSVAIATFGRSRVTIEQPGLQHPWPEADWRKRASFSQQEAGRILVLSPRTVRRRADLGKLNRTSYGRIVRDEKFEREFQKRHAFVTRGSQKRKVRRRQR
jgi:hypothetical protein